MASKIQGITVEIGGDTTKLGNALDGVNKKSKSLQSELKGVNTLLKMDPGNVTLLKQKQDLLNQSIAECREKLNILKTTQAQVQAQFNKGEITQKQYREFQREIIATENKLRNLEKQSKSFGSVSAQQIAAVGSKMEALGGKITEVGQKFKVVSAVASTTLVGITASAMNFESAWTGVTKTVDGTDEQLEAIKQGLLDLSEVTASSASDIAAVAEAAGQLGVKQENVLAFTETMVRLGDSTNLSADEAATAIAQLYNIMGSDINTVDQFGAAIVALGNNAATTEADIMNMASRIASSGKQVGLTEQEVLALATSLSSVGLEAEGGGSAISAVITKIDKDVALNSNTLKTWANVAGMSVRDFKNLWKNDAMSAIQSVVKGMGDASAGGKNLNVILDDLGVKSLRQTDTMKRLSGASELMTEMVDISNTAWKENTALTTESEKRYQTTAAKMQQLKNTVQELCVKLGEILLPIIQKICDGLSGFVDWLTNLSPSTQKVIVVILALVAAIAPLLTVVGKFISSIGSILTILPKILSIFSVIKTAISGLFGVLLANPIVLIIAAISALIAIFVTLWNKCEWFRNFWIGLWETIKSVFNIVINFVTERINNFISFVLTIANTINTYVIQPIWSKIQEFLNMILTIVNWINDNVVQPVLSVIIPIIQKIQEIGNKIWEIITTIFSVLCQWVYDNVIGPTLDIIISFKTSVEKFFKSIWDKIVEIFSNISNWFSEKFRQVKQGIIAVFGPIIEWFSNRWNDIKNIFSAVGGFFGNIFQNAWQAIKNAFSNVASFFQNIWNTIKNMFTNIGSAIGNGIGNAFKNVVNSIIGFAENTINKFIRAINNAINLINYIPGVNISKLKELKIPKLKVGMENVPYDNYLALLHKGERVLTAKENQNYGKEENNKTTTINNEYKTELKIGTFNNNREQDVQGLAEELSFYQKRYNLARGEK